MKQKRAKDSLREMDVRPSKERGQNFIVDQSVLHTIVDFGHPEPGTPIVEIGPGLGALTKELAPFGSLTLIEIEPKFCEELQKQYPEARVINQDVRTVQFSEIGKDLLIFGNLPYSFSTDIIFHLVSFAPSISRAVLMLQREFAERLAAPPGGRDYGVLSVNAQMMADISLGPIIPGTAFHPIANVDSRLVELKFLSAPRVSVPDMDWFKKVVKASFLQRRRKLWNSLKASCIATPEVIESSLVEAVIDPGRRAETLSIAEFAALASALRSRIDATSLV